MRVKKIEITVYYLKIVQKLSDSAEHFNSFWLECLACLNFPNMKIYPLVVRVSVYLSDLRLKPDYNSLSLSLSHTHTHTHTENEASLPEQYHSHSASEPSKSFNFSFTFLHQNLSPTFLLFFLFFFFQFSLRSHRSHSRSQSLGSSSAGTMGQWGTTRPKTTPPITGATHERL